MIKSHSMGIGDLLRSSAAWRALKDRWPQVELHLLFLSKHPGYAAEELIRSHHLLSSATFLTLREGSPHVAKAKRIPYRLLREQVRQLAQAIRPDLVIDFEASGLRSTLLTRNAAHACSAKSLGIGQFPGRGLFYDIAAPGTAEFARSRAITLPMDYTNRDFVALAGLGIEREDRPIELELSKTGLLFAEQLKRRLPVGVPVLGLNIGCGTPDAFHKRPDMAHLVECLGASLQGLRHSLVLSGAAFERDINQEFMARYATRWGDSSHMLDLGGETSLDTLTGLIEVCDVFISTDSGPYHMAVAMKKPTLVWLTYAEVTSFHKHPWCRTLIQPTTDQFKKALTDLMPPLIVTS